MAYALAMAVRRVSAVHGAYQGRSTLVQQFRFEGSSAATIADLLRTAPLVGAGSVFGERPGDDEQREGEGRRLRGFSPAPGFRFDVDLTRWDGGFMVRFSQPARRVPYLQGGLLWALRDVEGGVVLDEQINTEAALVAGAQPLGGPRPSLRRWLFFRAGHPQVMKRATRNLAALVAGAG